MFRSFIGSPAESIRSGFSHSAQAAEPFRAGADDTLALIIAAFALVTAIIGQPLWGRM